ncbi:alpha/beta fold hydrolase [Paenibacillus lemnae]|uniref:Alpha/beta hydrolase n=1 Tax=Paenibacillus lemnae TaxID=1330551 RepID=A0A848M7J2_PAELE|nr:alpha/beta hydrolase [Paenibacillus lemnae]NMO96606.1 alpha/beta hydrolase [Paenibacillus lemnae]
MTHISFIDKSLRLAVSIAGLPLTFSQTAVSGYQWKQHKPSGKLVSIGDTQLHAVVSGEPKPHTPTVILESGMGGCSLDWSLVQPELSKHTQVLSYDRAGFGWSTTPMEKPTCRQYVEDLRLLLSELRLKPPYILVGHSYGGMMMKLFASLYPEEVTGLMLVDAVHEDRYDAEKMDHRRIKERRSVLKLSRLGYILSPIGLPRLIKRHIGANRLPSHIQKTVTSLGRRNNAFQAAYSEILCTEESAEQLKKASPLHPDLPVIVLTAGKQSDEWKQDQKKLLDLTQRTRQIIVEESWHSIQIYQPQSVIEAVRSLLHT